MPVEPEIPLAPFTKGGIIDFLRQMVWQFQSVGAGFETRPATPRPYPLDVKTSPSQAIARIMLSLASKLT